MYYYIDHTRRFEYNTGIQRCVRAIALALMDVSIPLKPVIWDSESRDFSAPTLKDLEHLSKWNGPDPNQWSLNDRESHWTDDWLIIVELISGPYMPSLKEIRMSADKNGLKIGCVFHDSIPLRYPQFYGPNWKKTVHFHTLYMKGIASFDKVFANSFSTSEYLRDFLYEIGYSESYVGSLLQTIPLATELLGQKRPPSVKISSSNLWTNRGYLNRPMHILCVASFEPRKNHLALFKAITYLQSIQNLNAKFILVGWPNDLQVLAQFQRTRTIGLPIHWERSIDDQRLHALYEWADCTIYPSIEEGFGLPVAESLWNRIPCLCSGYGAIGELAKGGGCLQLNTSDWRSLVSGLQLILSQPNTYAKLIDELNCRTMRLWSDYANDFVQGLLKPE